MKEKYDVYAIYQNGELYRSPNRKIFYLKESHAKAVITEDSKNIAKYFRCDSLDDWYGMTKEEQNKMVEDVKKTFKIVPYIPLEEETR